MSMWEIREDYDDDYGRSFGMRSDEYEQGFKDGCRHGYEKAMQRINGSMGYRQGENGENYGSSMGERRMPGYFPESPMYREMPPYDEMGERRRRRSNGQFY